MEQVFSFQTLLHQITPDVQWLQPLLHIKNLALFFFPLVDYFAALKISGSYYFLKNYTDVQLTMEISGVTSDFRVYRLPTLPIFFVPTYGMAINLDSGNVTGLSWDNYECSLCNKSVATGEVECFNGGDCVGEDGTDSPSDVYIYLAWDGTDLNGDNCQTLNYLPSQFAQYSVTPVFNAATSLATTSFNGGP